MVAWYFLPLNVPSPLFFVATKYSKGVVLAVQSSVDPPQRYTRLRSAAVTD
jgi:hypothetical protein